VKAGEIMGLSSDTKTRVINDYQRFSGDTGSPEVQVALLSARIEQLSSHFKGHAHDHHSRQGLLKMVSRRRKLLEYLKRMDSTRYQELISRLGLRK
jgi:small subunit ribosomal protein S15